VGFQPASQEQEPREQSPPIIEKYPEELKKTEKNVDDVPPFKTADKTEELPSLPTKTEDPPPSK